jgi:RNA polymerase sigma-70 factor, ECF subfamily
LVYPEAAPPPAEVQPPRDEAQPSADEARPLPDAVQPCRDAPPPEEAELPPEERPSFDALYSRYFDFGWRGLSALGVPDDRLEDAAQEVWLAVFRRLPDFEARSAPGTWVFGIVINVARNVRRAMRRLPSVVPLREDLVALAPDPLVMSERNEAWQQLRSFLSELDEQRREIFVCVLLEGMRATEAAEAVGVPETTVVHRVRALRRTFQRWVEARGLRP